VIRGIDYLVDECPIAAGNRHLGFKDALNTIETQSPGTKTAFYLNFVEKVAPLLAAYALPDDVELRPCAECGSPTTGEVCAFCNLVAKARAHDPVPVELITGRGARRR
jgi:uncharacterized protein (TIGR00269 family)